MSEAELVDESELESARRSTRSSTRCDVVEVVTRGERRRHRSEDERATILSEAMAPGAIVAHVDRHWGGQHQPAIQLVKKSLTGPPPEFDVSHR